MKIIQINKSDVENLRMRLKQDPTKLSSRLIKSEYYDQACQDVYRILVLQVEQWISEVTKEE